MKVMLEGLDGTGKTTIGKLIEATYGFKYVHFPTRKPDKPFSEMTDRERYEFFVNDQIEGMKAFSDNYDNIVYDRGFVSTMLYQSKDNSEEELDKILTDFEERYGGRIDVDVIVILTAKPEVSLRRIMNDRKEIDYFENLETLSRVASKIPTAVRVLRKHGYRVHVIDTSDLELADVFEEVLKVSGINNATDRAGVYARPVVMPSPAPRR